MEISELENMSYLNQYCSMMQTALYMDGVDRLDAYMHLHGSDVAIQTLA